MLKNLQQKQTNAHRQRMREKIAISVGVFVAILLLISFVRNPDAPREHMLNNIRHKPFKCDCDSAPNIAYELVSMQVEDESGSILTKFPMALYKDNETHSDAVSRRIRRDGVWEVTETREILNLLGWQSRSGHKAIFLDVGANMGWHTLNALARGHRVVAFEPMTNNVELLCKSVCVNDFTSQLTLFKLGASDKDQVCSVQSETKNVGDGKMACTDHSEAQLPPDVQEGGIVMSKIDTVLESNDVPIGDIAVMKIDVEGFEAHALRGAQRTIMGANLRFVYVEVVKGLLARQKSSYADVASVVMEAGFNIDRHTGTEVDLNCSRVECDYSLCKEGEYCILRA